MGYDATRRQVFARKLNALMGEQALTPKSLGDRMRAELNGEAFNLVNLSHYRAGRSLPRPRYLKALSAAVGVPAESLLGIEGDPGPAVAAGGPTVRIEGVSDSEAFLHIDQRLPWSVVLRVLQALELGAGDGLIARARASGRAQPSEPIGEC